MIRRKNATGLDIYVEFKFKDKTFTELIDIPFEVFIEAFRQYSSGYKDVNIDGTDARIWNLLIDLGAIETLSEQENFLSIAKEIYLKSAYYEEDLENWTEEMQDDYDFENKLGQYAPEKGDGDK
jgi:hypothetical protein